MQDAFSFMFLCESGDYLHLMPFYTFKEHGVMENEKGGR